MVAGDAVADAGSFSGRAKFLPESWDIKTAQEITARGL